jgi:hypothetical protein
MLLSGLTYLGEEGLVLQDGVGDPDVVLAVDAAYWGINHAGFAELRVYFGCFWCALQYARPAQSQFIAVYRTNTTPCSPMTALSGVTAATSVCRRLHCQGLQLGADVDLTALATSCFGYSGADLAALVREAAMHAFSTAAAHLLDQGRALHHTCVR